MPHAAPVPSVGVQALILCGPGLSLNTFTSKEESEKCLIPVANRPMVFYPLDFCRRSGITDVTLITPSSSVPRLQAALQQNPHLTALQNLKPSIVAAGDMTMGTAEILRLPEVQAAIKTDFLVLPCDLLCEIPGESLLEAWMVYGAAAGTGTRGGLSVYYQTQGREESVKGEATDFLAIAPLGQNEAPAVSHPSDGPAALRLGGLSKVVLSAPMDTIKENIEQDKGLLIRHSLVQKHPNTKILTTFRDSHIYIFPKWVKDLARRQEKFQSISEDLIGYWAKSEWQQGLGEKLGLDEIFEQEEGNHTGDTLSHDGGESVEEEIDLQAMSTTKSAASINVDSPISFASRVKVPDSAAKSSVQVPPILAHVQRSAAPFVRRVDSSAILLSTSLRLAKLESIEEVGRQAASPFAHNQKIAHPEGVAQRCTVTKSDCLLDRGVTVAEKSVIKESVLGPNVKISSGARLQRCLVLEGAVIGERCQLTNCIIGAHSQIGRESVLKDCEVQDGNVVPEETDAKNEKFMVFEGFDDDDMDDAGDFDNDEDDEGF
ncbi:eukaryotic translation initiation factor subunit eIF2B-gamma [Penicillium macrosclerotiorum]|uniref:eukaryotic translation initiation factor subunit eIF2B-gamma n=1 Tax=Penicillium macrosclerotiorum TaxID=303699 RepID=UPI002549A326|nr:eukaryotic translation initiation factor subunit eIF2B-gamma [Penicillium macrosclerotiorum]KAJ5682960.1 eukaryotic translation initiation factor subunit eIF2B-gamma [Penicillium macrosclerotiorum]